MQPLPVGILLKRTKTVTHNASVRENQSNHGLRAPLPPAAPAGNFGNERTVARSAGDPTECALNGAVRRVRFACRRRGCVKVKVPTHYRCTTAMVGGCCMPVDRKSLQACQHDPSYPFSSLVHDWTAGDCVHRSCT